MNLRGVSYDTGRVLGMTCTAMPCVLCGRDLGRLSITAEDVLSVIESVGPVASLIGHSFGGAVALSATLADHEQIIPKLVVYEPATATAVRGLGGQDERDELRRVVLNGDYEYAIELNFQHSVDAGVVPASSVEALRVTPLWWSLVERAPTLPRNDELEKLTEDRLSAIAASTLVIAGSESGQPLKDAVRSVVNAIPDATVATLIGQGHLAQHFATAELAETIANFMGQTGGLG